MIEATSCSGLYDIEGQNEVGSDGCSCCQSAILNPGELSQGIVVFVRLQLQLAPASIEAPRKVDPPP